MIATSLISLFSAALLIWILIYIYKQKWVHKQTNKKISCMSKKIQSLFLGRQEEARYPNLLRRDEQARLALGAPQGAV